MSLKVKLISAISLFILMLGALILGVFAASQQTITMQGNITFNVSDRSLYVKAVRYQATGEEAIDVTSFSQGYINENFNLDLTSLSQAEPNKHGSFTLYFDIINATNMQWAIESVTLSETLISEGVTESHSGIIEVNELTETDSEGFKVFDVATAPYDTLSLTIIAPQASTTNPLNLSDITITIKEYIPPEITDFTFARTSENTGVAVRYTGAETEVEIPETFSVITEQLEEPGYTIEIKTQEDYMALFGDEYFPLVLMSGYYYITTPLLGRVYVTDYELFSQTLTEAAGGTIDVTDIIPMTIEVTDYEIIYQDFISSEYTQYAIIKPFMEISMGEVENVTIEFNSGEKYEINAINYIELLYVIQYNSLYLYEEVNFPVKISYPSTKVTYVEGDDYFVTSLGGMAFSDNVNITSITIPDGITSIGSQAFSGCSNLYSVSLPSSLTSVGEDAFTGCTSLNYYKEDGASYLGNVNNPYVYLANVTTTVTEYTINSNTKFIGDNAFSGNSTLTSVTIPEEVTSIGSSAFQSCSGLINITIPTGVVYIGSNAFENCSNLKNITIPTGVTIINEGTFSDCSGLTNVFFENNSQLTSIGASAFSGCSSLTDITIPSGVTIIGNSAFARSGLTSITIPDGVNDIGLMTFLSCESLKNVTLSETLIIVGGWAFSSCSSLESIIIPEGVISIGQAAFSGCSNLTNVSIPSSVTSIGNSAFNGCTLLNCYIDEFGVSYLGNENEHYIYLADAPTTLTEYTINNNCVTIGDNAFSGCSNLASITIPENVTGINESAFEDCSSLTNITIPSGVTSIEDYTFRNCSGLTSITLPSSLTSIGWYAFDGCSSLTNVNLPNTLTSIGYRAFYNCSGLSNITIPEGVTSIESYAFEDCISLTSITLPSTLTNIGWSAFENCSSLTSITIPESVTSIDLWAFRYCDNLTTVTINEYIYTNASSSSSCGYILENAQTVYVPEELVNNSALTMGSYLQNYFTQEELVNGLYTYTRN